MADTPWLGGKPVSFREAYPQIAQYRVEVTQDPWGYHCQHDWQRTSVYTNGLPSTIRCANPRCQQGGLDLQVYIDTMVCSRTRESAFQAYCRGHEGSPKGRRKGAPCDNRFDLKIELEFQKGA